MALRRRVAKRDLLTQVSQPSSARPPLGGPAARAIATSTSNSKVERPIGAPAGRCVVVHRRRGACVSSSPSCACRRPRRRRGLIDHLACRASRARGSGAGGAALRSCACFLSLSRALSAPTSSPSGRALAEGKLIGRLLRLQTGRRRCIGLRLARGAVGERQVCGVDAHERRVRARSSLERAGCPRRPSVCSAKIAVAHRPHRAAAPHLQEHDAQRRCSTRLLDARARLGAARPSGVHRHRERRRLALRRRGTRRRPNIRIAGRARRPPRSARARRRVVGRA